MTIHREGYRSIAVCAFLFGIINIASFSFLSEDFLWLSAIIFFVTLFLLLFIVSFFRVPERNYVLDENKIIAPADGKVVVIEEVFDEEYFKEKRLQVSIFMSPANVHRNIYPASGKVVYSKYHKGKYLVAWDPKSSTENERHSVVIETKHGQILVKQIAGALAKRICNYAVEGNEVKQCSELGFIKFGSRVDLLLPLSAKLSVKLNDKVKNGLDAVAEF